jgi:hypothetical protein
MFLEGFQFGQSGKHLVFIGLLRGGHCHDLRTDDFSNWKRMKGIKERERERGLKFYILR